jgi:hypothetical protein
VKISNRDDRISTRDVLARIEELQDDYATDGPTDSDEVFAPVDTWSDGDRAEYASLQALIAECESNADYSGHVGDGMFLTREPQWVDYTREYYDETYGQPWIKTNKYGDPMYDQEKRRHVHVSWADVMDTEPFKFIDWQAAADNLRRDCPEIEWEGMTWIIGP